MRIKMTHRDILNRIWVKIHKIQLQLRVLERAINRRRTKDIESAISAIENQVNMLRHYLDMLRKSISSSFLRKKK